MRKFPGKCKAEHKVFKLFLLLILIAGIHGCNPITIPIKGKYMDTPSEITLTKSADSTWLKITDLFAAKGLKVKSIDKQKGQLITKKTSFMAAYTFEDIDGRMEEAGAWVVLHKVLLKEKQWMPKEIYSKWNIQISELNDGRTVVKVDPKVTCTYYPNMFTVIEAIGQSTGTLEGLIKSSID